VALPEMLPGEQVVEDYRYLSLSLKAHPVSFLREEFRAMGITRSVDLLTVRNGQRVTIGGIVLVRQRPGSAKGVIFMTLEDETGVANAIVWSKVFERYRPVVMGARLVKIRGRLQSQSSVIHTVVEHIEDITPMLGLLQKEAKRLGVSARSDEALQSSGDHRAEEALEWNGGGTQGKCKGGGASRFLRSRTRERHAERPQFPLITDAMIRRKKPWAWQPPLRSDSYMSILS
jgi:error-prone DNA polymerase